jgi:hypothetical protein
MRAAARIVGLILFAFAGSIAAQTVTLDRWQDMGPLLDRQSKKINEHSAQVAAMQAEINVLKTDMGLVIQRYDTLLRAIVVNVCMSNKIMADNQWAATLIGLKPIGIAGHTCPADLEAARYYVPSYLSADGPPIPPATAP